MTSPAPTKFPELSEIEAMEDFMDAYMLSEEFHVSAEGLTTFEELKERLVLEYYRLKGRSYKSEVSKAIIESGEDDNKKRKQLIDMLKQITTVTHPDQQTKAAEMLDEFLSMEGTSNDVQADCEHRIENLQNGECVIIVAGESSAGKSSVLNLLFEENILPVFAGSCTATITTVRYGQRTAKILFTDPAEPTETIQLDEAGIKRFNDLVFLKGQAREEGHSIQEIQLYLPLWFLRTGLVLADTPGIGETAFLEEYLIDYISKNQILGFMYVIMSDAAGGVKEDRLLLLLKMIIDEQKKRQHSLPFDPKAALFVCNRFDAVQEDERPQVKSHILEKLGKFWPEFNASQTVFFSAQNALRDVDAHPDYINAEYRVLLDALKKLFCVSMDRRIKSSYKWIEKLLHRITHFLKSTAMRLDMSDRDSQDKSLAIRRKLKALSSKTDQVILELRAEIKEKAVLIGGEVKEYLQKPQAKFMLCSAWKEEEIPELSETVRSISHWHWVKEKIDLAFFHRLCNLLEEWGDENCNIQEIESKVVDDIRAKLGVLEEEICDMELDMHSDTASLGSQNEDEAGTRSRRMSASSRRLSIRAFNPGNALVDVPTMLPLQVLSRIRKPKSSGNVLTSMGEKRKTKIFNKNPQAWARGRAEKLLKKILSESSKHGEGGILDELMMQLLQRPLEYIEMVEEKVPGLLKANEQLLQSIEFARLNEKKNIAKFVTMMEEIENLRTSLKNYGEGYIFVDDFKSNEVKVLQMMQSGQSLANTFTSKLQDIISRGSEDDMLSTQTTTPRGLWSLVNQGILKQGDNEQPISIRFYLPSSGVENTFAEVAKLRCLIHDGLPLAEFLGIHHAELQLPAFIYSGSLQSARRFILHASDPRAVAPSILQDTAAALCYLHGKGLVHMELSAATVTVDESGCVKLTGACMPRRATLPLDVDTAVSDFVYLSPEVLTGDLYISLSDVYGFGLLMFELLTQRLAFQRQRKFPFQLFVKEVNPLNMLFSDTEAEATLPSNMFRLLNKCVEVRDSERPHMADVAEALKASEFPNYRKSFQTMNPRSVFRMSKAKEKVGH